MPRPSAVHTFVDGRDTVAREGWECQVESVGWDLRWDAEKLKDYYYFKCEFLAENLAEKLVARGRRKQQQQKTCV